MGLDRIEKVQLITATFGERTSPFNAGYQCFELLKAAGRQIHLSWRSPRSSVWDSRAKTFTKGDLKYRILAPGLCSPNYDDRWPQISRKLETNSERIRSISSRQNKNDLANKSTTG